MEDILQKYNQGIIVHGTAQLIEIKHLSSVPETACQCQCLSVLCQLGVKLSVSFELLNQALNHKIVSMSQFFHNLVCVETILQVKIEAQTTPLHFLAEESAERLPPIIL